MYQIVAMVDVVKRLAIYRKQVRHSFHHIHPDFKITLVGIASVVKRQAGVSAVQIDRIEYRLKIRIVSARERVSKEFNQADIARQNLIVPWSTLT